MTDNQSLQALKQVIPVEQLSQYIWYKDLDGGVGSNRQKEKPSMINAANDFEAIQCWLKEYKESSATHRRYQREAERLLLWAVIQRQKAFSCLTREDFEEYFEFMANPQPREFWCGAKGGRGNTRGSSTWKPFVGPLGQSTIRTTIDILCRLLEYLVHAPYLETNPLALMVQKKQFGANHDESKLQVDTKILEPDEWQALLDTITSMPEDTPLQKNEKARTRFIVAILYLLGLRVSEVVNQTWKSFQLIHDRWWFVVKGKGGKVGKIPANQALMEEVKAFRTQLRLHPYPYHNDHSPLLPKWRGQGSISSRQVNLILKKLSNKAAEQFSDRPDKQEKLRRFSAHWLRHLSASMQDKAGVSFTHIKENLRHSSGNTTRLYVHALDHARHEEIDKLLFDIQ